MLNDSVHDLYAAVRVMRSIRTSEMNAAMLYFLAGCDFTPGIYGIGHEQYGSLSRPFFTTAATS